MSLSEAKSVLIAEDDKVSNKLLTRGLEKLGYRVVSARDGREALNYYQENHFPVVITDWMMPNMDGLELVKAIRNIQSEEYTYIIMLTSKNEKGDLIVGMKGGADDYIFKPLDPSELEARLLAGERVVHLERNLLRQKKELSNANQRMKKDLDAAAAIQSNMLPHNLPNTPNITVDWAFKACDELAGDTFNVFRLDDRYLGVYILDVSGHGVPAALLAFTLSRMLSEVSEGNSLVRQVREDGTGFDITAPSQVARVLNRRFQISEESSQFFTLIYGVLDTATYNFRYISAGHPEIVRISAGGSEVIRNYGVPVGVLDEIDYPENNIQLHPGDRLYFYSDGIPEARDASEAFFGLEQMGNILHRHFQGPLSEGIESLIHSVENWCEHDVMKDDISLLGIEINPDAPEIRDNVNSQNYAGEGILTS
ncbi:MAG: SpoIIE family protein phosphatase [Calditrichaeota bacterium]|nr:SpoIIE family protein phosphatase [Calditrichota bacterium]